MSSTKKDVTQSIKYGFSSGQVRVLEKRLFSKNMVERLLDAKDFQAQLHILAETEYSHFFQNINTIEELENAFEGTLEECYRFLEETSEDIFLVDFFKLKYDYHNLKIALKERLTNTALENNYIKLGKYSLDQINTAISDSTEQFDKNIAQTINKVKKIYDKTNNPNVIDLIIDHRYFDHLLFLARLIKSNHLVNLVKSQIDLTNIKTVARRLYFGETSEISENHLIEGGHLKRKILQKSSKNINEFTLFLKNSQYDLVEKIIEEDGLKISLLDKINADILFELNKDIKYEIAGIEIVAAYFFAREYEIKTLRMILINSFRKITGQPVRERILDIYA